MKRSPIVLLLVLLALPMVAAEENGKTFAGPAGKIYYEVRGGGSGTPLLLVNGGPGFDHNYFHSSAVWDALATKRAVIMYDQRGTGRSDTLKPTDTATLADQLADLEALRAHLGFAQVDMLGHSWGGYLAMAYAARYPQHIRRLIICDSAAPKWSDTRFLFDDIFPEGVLRQNQLDFDEKLGDAEAGWRSIREYLAMLFYSPEKRDQFLAHADEYHYVPDVNAKVNADLARFDLGPRLGAFRMPVLVLTGRFDINVAPSTAWKIHNAIPGSQFAVFEKSGHLPWFEEPEAFQRVVEPFLDR